MIITFMIITFLTMVRLMLWVIPSVPPTPEPIVNGGDWLIDQIEGVASMLSAIYGSTLLTAIITVLIFLLSFEYIYWATMWVLKKIPLLNIK